MSTPRHNRSVILEILLIAWVLGSSSIVIGQSPELHPTAADSSKDPLPPIPAPSPYRQPSIRKFTFKHAKAGDVLKILRQLEPEQKVAPGFAVDERTNSFIFQLDDDQQARVFEELYTLLDVETPAPGDTGKGLLISVPALGPQPLTFDFSFGIARGESLESLNQRYNELEQQTHQLAEKLKQSKSPSEPERTELKTAVRKSFEARQALQRAELADLVQRMKSMQQSIDMRDKLADKVVQRRVEDLLDPNLKWEVTRTSNESTRSISKEDSISSNTITSSQEMQAALQGTWNVRVFQSDNMGDDRVSQVVVRGDLLLVHTIVKGKVLGVSPWKLVWPNAERPYELGVIWDPNSNAESNSEPARIAYDGKSFQLAWGENPNAICPGENIAYIDCVRGNIVDRSTATADTEGAADSNLQSDSIPIFNTPQELLDAVEQHGKSGSYGDFVTLFNDEGVRDLAGSLLMSAMMQTSMDELSRQQTSGGLSEVDPGTVAVRKVLQRWLPQSLSADQREYVGKGLSAMMSSIGGTSPDQAAMKEFVISMRKSVEGIADHRKFCIELMQAYEKLTTKPFVYFGNADQKNEWQLSQFGERAIATLIDGSPGMATTITLQQASGDWRISSLFNELVEMTKEDESVARPITPAMEMQQRLQGEWDVKVMGYSPDMHVKQPYQAVVRGQLFLLQCMEDGKVIGTSTWKMIWPEADHPDVVDIVWDPNNNSDEYCAPGRITCDGKSFQVAWRSDDSISGPAIRPTEICSGEGISYFECVRKQPAD